MVAVELRGATAVFPETETTVCLDLRADAGERLVLLGPSGSGKTTALRLIAGLVKPDAGDVLFDERSMNTVEAEARGVAMVFQSHALFPFHTVAENVAYGLRVRRIPKAERRDRAIRALADVSLDGYADRWPSELSGGERQRVALARAMIVDPKVLLLDEPLASLDPGLRSELQELICDVQRARGTTTVFVTHDRHEARVVGDKIAVVLGGRVRQTGTADDVFSSPVSSEVANFVGTGPRDAAAPAHQTIRPSETETS